MLDHDFDTLTAEKEYFRTDYTDFTAINISMDCPDKFEFFKSFIGAKVSYISCMPNFITAIKEIIDSRVDPGMGVGEKSNAFHTWE
jgi:hypothetical protein